jgi:GNAT superfamily N-acetyltransferase
MGPVQNDWEALGSGRIIRPATMADLPAVVDLLLADDIERSRGPSGQTGTLDRYVAAFELISEDRNIELFVVTQAGDDAPLATMQLVYIAGLSWQASLRAQLQGVRVAAAERGKGVGSEMLAWAVSRARQRGASVLQLSSDHRRSDAHRWYLRMGFAQSHTGFRLDLASHSAGTTP